MEQRDAKLHVLQEYRVHRLHIYVYKVAQAKGAISVRVILINAFLVAQSNF